MGKQEEENVCGEKYTLDPEKISLRQFRELIRSKRMLPGRTILHLDIDQRFGILSRNGVNNLKELVSLLASNKKITSFASRSGLPRDYLVLVRREARSCLARPFPISRFPGIPHEYVESLRSKGIRNTGEFFQFARGGRALPQLAISTGIPEGRLREILALCDLSRITGIGGLLARVIYQAGIRSVDEFTETDPRIQIKKYMNVIQASGYAAGHLTEDDIRYCIGYAKFIREAGTKSDGK